MGNKLYMMSLSLDGEHLGKEQNADIELLSGSTGIRFLAAKYKESGSPILRAARVKNCY